MTSTAETEDRIVKACRTIAAMWPAMLPTTVHAGIGRAPAKALITQPDESEDTADLPRIDVLVDIRRDVTIVLNGWVRATIEDRDLQHHIPRGDDAPGMAAFLERHARWWSGHEVAEVIADELHEAAKQCAGSVFPPKRLTVEIGACTECGETVKARPGATTVTCHACGCTGGVGEWINALIEDDLTQAVTLPRLAEILKRRLSMTVTLRTLQRWHADGILRKIEAFGPQPRWPRFDPVLSMRSIAFMHRPCPMCGKPWAGVQPVCWGCQPLMASGPTRATTKGANRQREPRAQPSVVTLAPEVEAHLKARRCEETGLPLAWCACGWCEAC